MFCKVSLLPAVSLLALQSILFHHFLVCFFLLWIILFLKFMFSRLWKYFVGFFPSLTRFAIDPLYGYYIWSFNFLRFFSSPFFYFITTLFIFFLHLSYSYIILFSFKNKLFGHSRLVWIIFSEYSFNRSYCLMS